jgi:hypothetical protein
MSSSKALGRDAFRSAEPMAIIEIDAACIHRIDRTAGSTCAPDAADRLHVARAG